MKRFALIIVLFLLTSVGPAMAEDFSGMWWDTNRPGSGIYIDYNDNGAGICGSWYLYDDRGNPQWFTFMGRAENNVFQAELYKFTGPFMGQTWDESYIRSETVGNITINFSKPDSLTVSYEIERITGTLNLTRFSNENCRGSLWWDPQKPGQGVAHFHFNGSSGEDLTGIVWYVYDSNGDPIWYTGVGGPDATTFDALMFTGPALGETWDASLVKSTKAGTITANFDINSLKSSSMPRIDMGFNIGGITGSLNLEPFTCPVAVPKR